MSLWLSLKSFTSNHLPGTENIGAQVEEGWYVLIFHVDVILIEFQTLTGLEDMMNIPISVLLNGFEGDQKIAQVVENYSYIVHIYMMSNLKE